MDKLFSRQSPAAPSYLLARTADARPAERRRMTRLALAAIIGVLFLATAANLRAQTTRPERPAIAPEEHWAFRPVRRPAVLAVRDRAWVRTPIDAFILARLEKAGLK